jgi:hypothetical protein
VGIRGCELNVLESARIAVLSAVSLRIVRDKIAINTERLGGLCCSLTAPSPPKWSKGTQFASSSGLGETKSDWLPSRSRAAGALPPNPWHPK